MLINNGQLITCNDSTLNVYQDERHKVYWKGLIFVNGCHSEIESIVTILKYFQQNASFDFENIRGNYCIYITDMQNDEKYFFSDNSGIFRTFICENIISTSFLELADYINMSVADLDSEAINEFLHLGYICFNKTFSRAINILDYRQVIFFNKGKRYTLQKNVGELNSTNDIVPFIEHFDSLSLIIRGKRIVSDLTGGIDSRLMSCMLKHFEVVFQTATCGGRGYRDSEISKCVADRLHVDHYITCHTLANLKEDDLKEIFKVTDAQFDIVQYHRMYQYNLDKKARNVDITLSGVGGEGFKEFWWLHDFPFYWKKKSNLERLYDLRIEGVSFPHEILGVYLKEHSKGFRKQMIDRLKAFVLDYNTQTYDNINSYLWAIKSGALLSVINNNFFKAYAPYLEKGVLRFAFQLPRAKRFYNNFHREMVTKYCPQIARVKTTENVTCSNNMVDKITDIFGYVLNRHKRLVKQIMRKLIKRTYLQDSPTNQSIYQVVKKMDMSKSLENTLKNSGMLAKNTEIIKLPDHLLGRFLTLGLFIERIKENRGGSYDN